MVTSTASLVDTGGQDVRIVGLLPEGVSETFAKNIAARVSVALMEGDGSTVRAMRIIPSSLVARDGFVEFVANVTVEPKRFRPDGPAGRSKVIDSVITLDISKGDVTEVRIPFFERHPL